MSVAYWQSVRSTGLGVPTDRRLDELTAELTSMLGASNPALRDDLAYTVLATWIDRGVYDDLLLGLGDGMAAGLNVGLGERGTTTVFRRSYSALVLAAVIARDNAQMLVPGRTILDWGDRIAAWFLRERDLRGFVHDQGWAHTVAHGADAIGVLAESPALGAPELTVLLDVLADRLQLAQGAILTSGEPDRLALATLSVLRRGLVPLTVVEPWIARVRQGAVPDRSLDDPWPTTANAEAFLRALHLHLALGGRDIPHRHDVLMAVTDALRITNAASLRP